VILQVELVTAVLAYANLLALELDVCGRLLAAEHQPETEGANYEEQSANSPKATHPLRLSFASGLYYLNVDIGTFTLWTLHGRRLFLLHFAQNAWCILP